MSTHTLFKQKEKSNSGLRCTHKSSEITCEKLNQTNINTSVRAKSAVVFFSKDPSLLSYHCLAEFFTGTHTAATELQTNFLPTSYWLARHVTSALYTK